MNHWHFCYAYCAKCGREGEKKHMNPLYTGKGNPHILCYLCESCYCKLLDELEIAEK